MGLIDSIFGRKRKPAELPTTSVETFTAYTPQFTSWGGQIYESELVRSAIESKARHISKLKVEMQGSAKPSLKARMKYAPNEWQTWPQFLARCSTILDCTNNLFIVPVQNKYFETTGYFPTYPTRNQNR